jgi:branched-chain amino acid aminotransferase
MTQPGHVWVDGQVLPAAGPHLSAFDRGFSLGDAVFETLRACGGDPRELEGHLERLARSAAAVAIALPAGISETLRDGIRRLLEAEGLDGSGADASVRITVSRGVVLERGLVPAADPHPTVVIQAWPVRAVDPGLLHRGLSLVVSAVRRDPGSPIAAVKSTSRADFIYARLEARRAGTDDALILTHEGDVAEATTANVFIVAGERLLTPPLDRGILAGTTRTWALGWAATAGLVAVEAPFPLETLLAADEVFLTSSVAGVLPVTALVDASGTRHHIGSGRPGPRTEAARRARETALTGG